MAARHRTERARRNAAVGHAFKSEVGCLDQPCEIRFKLSHHRMRRVMQDLQTLVETEEFSAAYLLADSSKSNHSSHFSRSSNGGQPRHFHGERGEIDRHLLNPRLFRERSQRKARVPADCRSFRATSLARAFPPFAHAVGPDATPDSPQPERCRRSSASSLAPSLMR